MPKRRVVIAVAVTVVTVFAVVDGYFCVVNAAKSKQLKTTSEGNSRTVLLMTIWRFSTNEQFTA